MRRLVIVASTLSLSFSAVAGAALAQETDVQGITTNADGAHVTSTTANPTANGAGGTIIYGDINTGPGYTVVEPPTVTQNGAASAPATIAEADPAPETVAAPAPAPETVPEPATAAPVAADTAEATETDLDADNYPDSLEWDLGLDGNNPDTDADGTADGDELTIYGTDPLVADTDGDGISDGEELFGISTDPLEWDDFSADTADVVAQETFASAEELAPVTGAEPAALAQETTESVTAIDGDAAALGPGSASASPGSVTRGTGSGAALLGPDGNYSVTEVAPPNVTVAGDTEVLSPPPQTPDTQAPETAPASTVAGCSSYISWYDAQVAYEAAGMTAADPAMVEALDPDHDGIACEEAM
jgi:hypothetical protein